MTRCHHIDFLLAGFSLGFLATLIGMGVAMWLLILWAKHEAKFWLRGL